MSDDVQDPRYHMSLCLVNSARSSLRNLATTWRVLRALKDKENLLQKQVDPRHHTAVVCSTVVAHTCSRIIAHTSHIRTYIRKVNTRIELVYTNLLCDCCCTVAVRTRNTNKAYTHTSSPNMHSSGPHTLSNSVRSCKQPQQAKQ